MELGEGEADNMISGDLDLFRVGEEGDADSISGEVEFFLCCVATGPRGVTRMDFGDLDRLCGHGTSYGKRTDPANCDLCGEGENNIDTEPWPVNGDGDKDEGKSGENTLLLCGTGSERGTVLVLLSSGVGD